MDRPTILVVEDEFIVALALKSFLESKGYAVSGVVSSGEEAVKHAKQEKPDFVLMDVSLKGRIDGIEAARRIKESLGIRSAFMSGYPADEVMARAGDVDAVACFVKPLEYGEVGSTLAKFLGPPDGEDG